MRTDPFPFRVARLADCDGVLLTPAHDDRAHDNTIVLHIRADQQPQDRTGPRHLSGTMAVRVDGDSVEGGVDALLALPPGTVVHLTLNLHPDPNDGHYLARSISCLELSLAALSRTIASRNRETETGTGR